MNCTTTYLRTQEEKIVAVLQLERNRDDDPEVWDIISKPPKSCCCCADTLLTAERGSIESEPFEIIEDAQKWAEKQLKDTKKRVEAYRTSKLINHRD